MKELIKAVREYAREHYESGSWDCVVESYDDEYLASLINDATTAKQAIANVADVLESVDSVRRDIEATKF